MSSESQALQRSTPGPHRDTAEACALLPLRKQSTSVSEKVYRLSTAARVGTTDVRGNDDHHDVTGEFDLSGALRRIRRLTDLSQRELSARLGVSPAVVGRAESGSRSLPLDVLARAAALAGLRLALLDGEGQEVTGMTRDAVRDKTGRRFPAHLDTRYGDIDWWHDGGRYSRDRPWYTFDRVRETRDFWRGRMGTPEDHQLPQPGDSPKERWAAQQRAAREQKQQELERLREAGELTESQPFSCECPPACDELDDWSGKPVRAEECACGCDVG